MLCALALAGCSSYAPPDLRVSAVDIADKTEHATVVSLTVQAINPNSVALPLREAEYSLSVDGKTAFRGVRSPEATLRRYGTQDVTRPAVVSGADAADLMGKEYEIRGWFTYQTPGAFADILFDAELRRPSVAFSGRGRFGEPIPVPPPAAPPLAPISPLPAREPEPQAERTEPSPPPPAAPPSPSKSEQPAPLPKDPPANAPGSDVRWSKPLPPKPPEN